MNCGQACTAIKRLIVHENKYNEIIDKLVKRIKSIKVGDPEDEDTSMGSLVSKRQLELLKSQVDDAKRRGAELVKGGTIPNYLKGAYYLPTILININRNMRVWREEVFGPVLPIIKFKSDDEAISLANDTSYGLSANIFTNDKEKFKQISSKIDAGVVEMNNAFRTYFAPFGGYKMSGIGREQGKIGFQELCQIKVISQENF